MFLSGHEVVGNVLECKCHINVTGLQSWNNCLIVLLHMKPDVAGDVLGDIESL